MSGNATVIALFPYLFFESDTEVRIDRLSLKSSYKKNLDLEEKELREALLTFAKCFRANRGQQFPISYWSYAVLSVSGQTEFDDSIKMINRISDVMRFSSLSKQQDRSHYSNFNYWIVQLDPRMKLDGEYVYLEAFMNGVVANGFNIKNGVATNPYLPQEHLTAELIRQHDLEGNLYFDALYTSHNFIFKEELSRQKLFRAIEWFNRSFSHAERGVDMSEAITNMHSAFEALLKPQQKERSSVKAEVKAGLMSLLGQRSEISRWFDSFHNLRNSLVHGDVEPASFLYIHPGGKVGNRPHLLLARKVFIACLDLILHSAKQLPLIGFEDELIPNESRINEAIRNVKLARGKNWVQVVEEKLFNPIGSLRSDDITSPKDKAVELGRLLLPYVREELRASNTAAKFDTTISQIDTILGWSSSDLSLLALAYSTLETSYQLAYFEQGKSDDQLSLRAMAHSFISYTAWRLLVFRG